MIINQIWNFLSFKERKKFSVLIFLSIIVLTLEIVSISTIFPFIYSLTDEHFLIKYEYLNNLYKPLNLDNNYFSIIILLFLFVIITIKNTFLSFFFWMENKFLYQTQEKISKNLYSNLINKDYPFHLRNNSGDLITRIRVDSVTIREAITGLFNLIQSSIFIFGILLFLIILEPIGFTITSLIFLILGSIFYKITSKKISEMGEIRQKYEVERTKKLQESFSGIKEIKTFLLDNSFIRKYDNIAQSVAHSYAIRGFILKLPKVFLETLVLIVIIVLTMILIQKTDQNSKIFALLGVFAVSAIKIIPHVYSVLNALNIFKFSKKPIEYYNINLKNLKNKTNIEKKNDFKFKEEITFENVCFSYPDKHQEVFKNLNFKIKMGDRIHLKGVTGSGKSTLIDLLLGLQKTTSGQIKVDKKALSSLGGSWFNNISYVPQSIYLFDDNIKKNITLSDKVEIDEEHFSKCLEAAELKNFISKLPNKENTQIGEVGSKISGGQKQRIGIARALYKKSEIIILDEATNAVDDITEKKIYINLNSFKNKTFIVINHREIPEELNFNKYLIEEKKLKLNA
tara:strand:+ start:4046 stop:5752 length:1707 start_codon:yes stop_codon:yes gene_type:complete